MVSHFVPSTYSILYLDEQVVDGDHVHGTMFDGFAENDAAKAIDSYFSRHADEATSLRCGSTCRGDTDANLSR